MVLGIETTAEASAWPTQKLTQNTHVIGRACNGRTQTGTTTLLRSLSWDVTELSGYIALSTPSLGHCERIHPLYFTAVPVPLTADTNLNMAERYYTLAEGDSPIENLDIDSSQVH